MNFKVISFRDFLFRATGQESNNFSRVAARRVGSEDVET